MSILAQTLKEIAIDKAKKRPELVDYLLEETPVLARAKWIPASHGLWNVEEVLKAVDGPSWVDLGAPLPAMQARTGLEQTYVSVLGGEVEVSKDKADQFGGPSKYFARRERAIIRKAGMDTEAALFTKQWRAAALKKGTKISCGGTTSNAQSTIMVVRMSDELNTGIYDPTCFSSGYLVDIRPINGGQEYHLRTQSGVLGYGVSYRGRFGWQLLAPERTVCALVNIEDSHLPTEMQLQDAIFNLLGSAASTMIIGHPLVLGKVFGSLKLAKLEYSNGDTALNHAVTSYYDIPIYGSYNLPNGSEAVVS